MVNYTAYIKTMQMGDNNIKVLIGIYDADILPEDRIEENLTIEIPYNQPEGYLKDKIKEALEKFKYKLIDFANKRTFIGYKTN